MHICELARETRERGVEKPAYLSSLPEQRSTGRHVCPQGTLIGILRVSSYSALRKKASPHSLPSLNSGHPECPHDAWLPSDILPLLSH